MITIVDYEAGNLTSVKRALDYLKIANQISSDPDLIEKSEKIIFPGVGHAESAMRMLNTSGIKDALKNAFEKGTPILGICLGTQIILSHSDEGDTDCIGLIDGNCPKFDLKNKDLKIPHMGWNRIKILKKHYIFNDFNEETEVYFVHSFYPQPSNDDCIYAVTEYEIDFPSAIGRDNLIATQFHPEKSGPVGLNVLKKFSEWDGVK
jgi:glutamine amidotransferase